MAPRAGVLEVALTWTPSDLAADPLGFSVVEPAGRHWYPPEPGITRRVQLQTRRQDTFRIDIWGAPGEAFELQTRLN